MDDHYLAKMYYETLTDMQIFRRCSFAESGILELTRTKALSIIFRQKQCSLKKLCAILGIKAPAGSALIEGLVKAGLVARTVSSADRREILISLTEAGHEVAIKDMNNRISLLDSQFSKFSEEDKEKLLDALETLHEIHRILDFPYPVPLDL